MPGWQPRTRHIMIPLYQTMGKALVFRGVASGATRSTRSATAMDGVAVWVCHVQVAYAAVWREAMVWRRGVAYPSRSR